MGFKQAACDPYLYVASKGEMFIATVYVDDIVVGSKSDQKRQNQEDLVRGISELQTQN